jgi:hypothetical protein
VQTLVTEPVTAISGTIAVGIVDNPQMVAPQEVDLATSCMVAVLPIAVIGWIDQKQLVRGLSMGAGDGDTCRRCRTQQ